MKNYKIIVFVLLSIFESYIYAGNFYYTSFTNMTELINDNWETNFKYGRDGILEFSEAADHNARFVVVNSKLIHEGRRTGSVGIWQWNNYWVGNMIRWNKTFNASAEEPFGFQLIRSSSLIDYNAESGSGTGGVQDVAANEIWLIQENGITNQWETFENSIQFIEQARYSYNNNRSFFGYFVGSEHKSDLTAVIGPGFATYDLTAGDFNWEWLYDDDAGSGHTDFNWNYLTWTNLAVYANTNKLGIRITHDGSKINFYMNPDPYDKNNYPNEYCYIGGVTVSWNTNLKIMIGSEHAFSVIESANASYEDILIRSVSANSKAMINKEFLPFGTYKYSIKIYPNIDNEQYAGIGEVILKPTIFAVEDIDLSSIRVKSEYGDNKNNGKACYFTKYIFSGNPDFGEIRIFKNPEIIKVKFSQKSDTKNQVIDYNVKNKEITISFNLKNPLEKMADVVSIDNISKNDMEVYVNNDKYEGDIYTKYATTGPQKCSCKTIKKPVNFTYTVK